MVAFVSFCSQSVIRSGLSGRTSVLREALLHPSRCRRCNLEDVYAGIPEAVCAVIDRARELTASFPEDVAMDLGNILRNIDRLLSDLLTNTSHDARELQWNSIAAQLNAVSTVGMFQAHPLASLMDRSLGELLQEIKAYLQGQVKLGAPAGILTQDGLNLFGIEDFTTKLGLGLGYIYNIDLCGSERFALSALRDSVVWDETSDRSLRVPAGRNRPLPRQVVPRTVACRRGRVEVRQIRAEAAPGSCFVCLCQTRSRLGTGCAGRVNAVRNQFANWYRRH